MDFPLPGAPTKITKTGFLSALNTNTQNHQKGINFCDSFRARNGEGSRRKPLGAEASSTSMSIFKSERFSPHCHCEFRSQAMGTFCCVVSEFWGCVGFCVVANHETRHVIFSVLNFFKTSIFSFVSNTENQN